MVKVLKWNRRVVGFMAVAKMRSYRVLLLLGGDQVDKLSGTRLSSRSAIDR